MKSKMSSPAKPASRQQPYSGSYAGIEKHPTVQKLREYAGPDGLGFQIAVEFRDPRARKIH